jgi:uncharacterized glyoxalase superfamily protein PhnB
MGSENMAEDFIMQMENTRIHVSNLQKSIEWYEKTFGVKCHLLYPDDKPNYAAFAKVERFGIMEHENYPSYGRFNFKVDDVDAWWDKLKDRTTVVEPLAVTPWGVKKFTIADPDGNELAFI